MHPRNLPTQTVNVGASAQSWTVVTIQFSPAFASQPRIIASASGNSGNSLVLTVTPFNVTPQVCDT